MCISHLALVLIALEQAPLKLLFIAMQVLHALAALELLRELLVDAQFVRSLLLAIVLFEVVFVVAILNELLLNLLVAFLLSLLLLLLLVFLALAGPVLVLLLVEDGQLRLSVAIVVNLGAWFKD